MMDAQTPDLATLAERVRKVEKQNRILRIASAVTLALTAGVVLVAASAPVSEVIKAERFVLVTKDGDERAVLMTTPEGSAGLAFYSENGGLSVVLGQQKDGLPVLSMYDDAGRQRFELLIKSEGPGLVLRDRNKKPRVFMGVLDDGSAGVGLADAKARPRLGINVHDDGRPDIELYDKASKHRLTLGLLKDGSVGIGLHDVRERLRADLRVNKEGSPSVYLYDEEQSPRIALGVPGDGSAALTVSGKDRTGRIGISADADGVVGSVIYDNTGRIRYGVAVSKDGSPHLHLLDDKGRALFEIPKPSR